uniref:Amine oxidase n=1 Tax=Zonotrichia albicollis TaxID=44394 RepID=A0A8D2QBW5_ZONAL
MKVHFRVVLFILKQSWKSPAEADSTKKPVIRQGLHGTGSAVYGNRLWEHSLGTLHTHFVNYKVDLDVGGVKNSLMAQDMEFEMAQAPWSPEQQIERPRLTRKVLDTEDQAAFPLHSKMPRYIYFAANSKNKWGHQRGYRIQITSSAGDHIPEASSMERAISWARYQLAVTRRKEEEPTSTSVYNQNDPWTPTVAFADFINNETITNQVSWAPWAQCDTQPRLNGAPRSRETPAPPLGQWAQLWEHSGFGYPLLCVSAWSFGQRTQRVCAEQKFVSPCGEMLAKHHENVVRPWRPKQESFH